MLHDFARLLVHLLKHFLDTARCVAATAVHEAIVPISDGGRVARENDESDEAQCVPAGVLLVITDDIAPLDISKVPVLDVDTDLHACSRLLKVLLIELN